jgi:hypothetical protein
LRFELVFKRNRRKALRNQQAGRDPDNNQSSQDGHLDFLPHCALPPAKVLLVYYSGPGFQQGIPRILGDLGGKIRTAAAERAKQNGGAR